MERMSSQDRREFLEAKYGKPTPGTFRGANYIPGTQLDAERKQANLIALQGLKNQGLLDVTERQQTGATKRTGLEQVGMTGRLGTTEAGLMSRLGQKLGSARDTDRRKTLQERLKFYTTPEYDKTGTMLLKAPLDFDTARKMSYGDVDMIYGNQGTENRRQDNIRSFRDNEDYLNFTNQPGGALTQVGANKEARTSLPGMPTTLRSARVNQESVLNQRPVYGPEYRGSVNPISRARNNRPITPTPLIDIFGDFNQSVNPRYR